MFRRSLCHKRELYLSIFFNGHKPNPYPTHYNFKLWQIVSTFRYKHDSISNLFYLYTQTLKCFSFHNFLQKRDGPFFLKNFQRSICIDLYISYKSFMKIFFLKFNYGSQIKLKIISFRSCWLGTRENLIFYHF